MKSYNDWLFERVNDYDLVHLKDYIWNIENKYFTFVDTHREGHIIKKNEDKTFDVHIDGDFCIMDLDSMNCLVDKGAIRNSDFCIKNGLRILNYLKKWKEFNLTITDKEFLIEFAKIIYKYSCL